MRSEQEVEAKFNDLYRRRLAQSMDKFLNCEPRNCIHNVRLRVRGVGKCGFCRNPEVLKRTSGEPFVCDEEEKAKRCKLYQCINTPETVRKDFEEVLRNPARCGDVYPKLAILIWFLQDTSRRSRYQRLKTALGEVSRSIFSLLLGRWW